MLRASASSSASVCSAAVTTLDCGALATTIPRRVAAATSTLSTPTPARRDDPQPLAALDQLGRHLRRRADQDRVVAADPLRELLGRPVEAGLDLEVLAQQRDARTRRRPRAPAPGRSREPLQQVVDAGGQRAHVVGLDRRGTSRPAAGCGRACGRARRRRSRSRAALAASAAASTDSSKSIVPTTSERSAGSRDERRRDRAALGPAVEVARGLARARDAPVEAAAGEHPVDLVGEQEERRDRRRVVRSGPCASCRARPASERNAGM